MYGPVRRVFVVSWVRLLTSSTAPALYRHLLAPDRFTSALHIQQGVPARNSSPVHDQKYRHIDGILLRSDLPAAIDAVDVPVGNQSINQLILTSRRSMSGS